MDLIDRYLDTLRWLLPADGRDDILAELRDVLMSRREEKETELGRPLTKKEDEELLRAFGNPLMVAGRYGRGRYLIGPDLYPAYMLVMKVVLGVIAASAVIAGVVMSAVNPADLNHAVRTAIGTLFNGSLGAVGWVTISFGVLQYSGLGQRMLQDWKVEDLPRFETRAGARRRRPEREWPRLVVAIAFQMLFLLWWTGVLPVWWADLPVEPHGMLHIAAAPIWQTLYLPVAGLSAGVIGINAAKLAGVRGRLAHALDIGVNAAVGIVALIALNAGRWVVISGAGLPPGALAKIDLGVGIGLHVSLLIVVLTSAIHIGVAAWQMTRPQAGEAARTA